jgi:uncharacterized protein YneF (UPF0154 family)
MNQGIVAAIVIGVIFLGIIGIIRAISEYLIKQKLINNGHIAPNALRILSPPMDMDNRFSALKWGLVVFFGGLGLISLEFIQYSHQSPFPYGVVAVCVSLGFLIYYLIVRKELIKQQDKEDTYKNA